MNLLEHVEHLWSQGAEARAKGWAGRLRDAKESILLAKQQFHEWYPLKAYLCYTDAIKREPEFSLRYLGQEVATLRVETRGDVYITIPPRTAAVNGNLFGITVEGKHHWREAAAQKFRRHFQGLNHHEYHSSVKSEEHHIESELLRNMKDPTGNKFNGTFRGIQPVTLGGFPFQFPVPISGNSGVPMPTRGNIDILARRGTGRGTRISVWELKRPDTTGEAISQAYIYSATVLKMLRTRESGDIWYQDIIGFGRKVSDKVTIESVVAVSIADNQKRIEFENRAQVFKSENPLSIGNDAIKLCIAHYRKDPLTVELIEV